MTSLPSSTPFHTYPYNFPTAAPPQSLSYWFDYLDNFKNSNPLHTAFDDQTNSIIPLDPPVINRSDTLSAPFNGPFPIRSRDAKTGGKRPAINAGVLVGFLLLRSDDPSLVWDPNNWCAVYGKMGKYARINYHKKPQRKRSRRRCIFTARDRNYLGGQTQLGAKGRIVAFERIFMIRRLRDRTKTEVEDYVAKGETRARKGGVEESAMQLLHLRSLQSAYLRSLDDLNAQELAEEYNQGMEKSA